MAHLDLYSALGLDRSTDCSHLAADIDRRLSSPVRPDGMLVDELSVARIILGDPYRRSIYDRQLSDPTAPDITIDAIRQLAAHSAPAATQPNPPTPRYAGNAVYGAESSAEHSTSTIRAVWRAAAAATAAVLLAIGAVVWIMNPPGDDRNTASGESAPPVAAVDEAATTIESTTSSAIPTTTSAVPVTPVEVESAPEASHHGDPARNLRDDVCGGRACDTAVLRLSGPVDPAELNFSQSYDTPVTTITLSHPAFTKSFSTGTGNAKDSVFITDVSAYSDGDGEIHIVLTNASGSPTFTPHLLDDRVRLVIDVEE